MNFGARRGEKRKRILTGGERRKRIVVRGERSEKEVDFDVLKIGKKIKCSNK